MRLMRWGRPALRLHLRRRTIRYCRARRRCDTGREWLQWDIRRGTLHNDLVKPERDSIIRAVEDHVEVVFPSCICRGLEDPSGDRSVDAIGRVLPPGGRKSQSKPSDLPAEHFRCQFSLALYVGGSIDLLSIALGDLSCISSSRCLAHLMAVTTPTGRNVNAFL